MDLRRFRLSESGNFMKRRSYNVASMHPVCVCACRLESYYTPPTPNPPLQMWQQSRTARGASTILSFLSIGRPLQWASSFPSKGDHMKQWKHVLIKTYLPLNLAGHGSSLGIRNPPSTFLNESWVRFLWLSSNILEDMSRVTMHMCIYL